LHRTCEKRTAAMNDAASSGTATPIQASPLKPAKRHMRLSDSSSSSDDNDFNDDEEHNTSIPVQRKDEAQMPARYHSQQQGLQLEHLQQAPGLPVLPVVRMQNCRTT
jgi:hypothetical protein